MANPKVTSSSNRSKRSTNKPITKGQNPQRANRQSVSQAKVTTSQQRGNRMKTSTANVTSGSNGKPASTGSAKVTTGMGGKLTNAALKGLGSAAMSTLRKNPVVGTAAAVMTPRPTAAGTISAAQGGRARSRFENARNIAFKKASAIKGSPVMGPRKSTAGQFDTALASARKAGKSTFTFKGKKYTTKMK